VETTSSIDQINLLRRKTSESLEFAYANVSASNALTRGEVNRRLQEVVALSNATDATVTEGVIYAAMCLMEMDVSPLSASTNGKTSTSSELLAEEGQRSRSYNPSKPFVPYIFDAEALLKRQKALYDEKKIPFDNVYYLACSIFARKQGSFSEARDLLEEFSSSSNAVENLQLVAASREVNILNLMMQPVKKPVISLKGVMRTVTNSEGKVVPFTPLVFTSLKAEWEHEKKKLSSKEAEKLVAMDKIMDFVGLNQVSLIVIFLFNLILRTFKGETRSSDSVSTNG
jgi:hypothetical protein